MQGFREWYQGFPSNTANFAITDFRRSVRKSFDITKAGGVHTKAGNESPAGRAPSPSPSLTLPSEWVSLPRPDSENIHHPRGRRSGGKCMLCRLIASRIFIGYGLVCSNVSGLFTEPSSWP